MIEKYLKALIAKASLELGYEVSIDQIVIETSKDEKHGDFATNIAMQLARTVRKNPREVATLLVSKINDSDIEKIEIAGPGFINFFLKPTALTKYIQTVIDEEETFGNGEAKNETINIEFVSANPTGKLHLGHARGAAVGDTMARLFKKSGYNVIKEFYVNDAGVQINNLGKSLYVRYLNLCGVKEAMPEDGYFSEDLIAIAKTLKAEIGDSLVGKKEEAIKFFSLRGSEILLSIIKDDLAAFRVIFDVYSFETKVRKDNTIEDLLLKLKPFSYVSEGATFLKTSEFGDDKDRVVIKANGDYTYFLPDIAYHLDKLSRGADLLIDLLGADHHGYIGRMKAALQMFKYDASALEVEIIQLVRIIKDGEEMKMSKRTGNAITLEELVEDIGVDAARYFFIAKSASTHFDFDLDLAGEKSNANPVFYAQYAHARLYSVLEKGRDYGFDFSGKLLKEAAELNLMKQLVAYPGMVSDATLTREPYKVANYVQKIASLIHTYYTESRMLDETNVALTKARLGLAKAAQIVLKDALNLLGVNAPTSM